MLRFFTKPNQTFACHNAKLMPSMINNVKYSDMLTFWDSLLEHSLYGFRVVMHSTNDNVILKP